MLKKIIYVTFWSAAVALLGIIALNRLLPIGPAILGITALPVLGLALSKREMKTAIPDLVFGVIDTGLLSAFAVFGGAFYGVAGAIAGGVIGDSITDGIAGFFEGGIAEWLRNRGIDSSRDPVTTALGKMAGCLLGSGVVLTVALLFGVRIYET